MAKLNMDDFSKGFEQFVKDHLDQRFDDFLKQYPNSQLTRSWAIVSQREVDQGYANIWTGLGTIAGHIIQIYRAGHIVTGDAKVSTRETMLEVSSGLKNYELRAGDKIHFIVW